MKSDILKIGKFELKSRLIVGTGKYASFQEMEKALEASGAQMVTVAVRRVNLNRSKLATKRRRVRQQDAFPPEDGSASAEGTSPPTSCGGESLLDFVDPKKYILLPNTAGCYTKEEAIRIARLGRAAGLSNLVKLEVIGDEKTLLPDTMALLEATKELVKDGFIVMPYTNDDPIVAKKLEALGAACVMPLAAPIGSGRGIQNRLNLKFILEAVSCPVIVDAGVGTASDASICMELGADGVLMNTAIALAENPVLMAEAMREAVSSGRKAYLAGRIAVKEYGSASSPQERFTARIVASGK